MSALDQMMAWRRTGNKPLSDVMMTQFMEDSLSLNDLYLLGV